ncbi:efflux RND transporter periplasmic adaptor subunit [Pseudodesulfovibrio piezophilus]|uniref:Acriflavine resistance protein A n=1 Tax=Pseudodesulfovibrio piezophilus (strain DSM 21447 / JCM 15486 / C1TLV30) TaxID=1322246 RepID=M1WRR3_PSEP2|nr:efflux RND transporter periplasmic adaptor subunit [Pseudodesulfovibrio piezophilus]CCH48452.1 Acriflavine resistance protein A [Pseudodesulfovibrio piezophilus C1TLV30]
MSQYIKFTFVAIMASLCVLTGCVNDAEVQADSHKAQPPEVEVTTITTSAYQNTTELPGRIVARRVAQVRARVAGIILSRDFEEGSEVKQGQPLFHIDPAQFVATQAQAQAELAKAEANMVDLEAIAERYNRLIKTKSISQQEYDTAVNNYRAAKASKTAAEAAVRTATLNLSYATVKAPISGRIGRALVTEGALVGEGEATHLATIQQLNPIYADINQPVSEYLKLKAAMNDAVSTTKKAEVTLSLEDIDYSVSGKLLFSDITVDQETSQVSFRSEFPNPDRMLLPGMFVRIKINLGQNTQTIFIPQRAVQLGSDGAARVLIVDEQNTAQQRVVKTGLMHAGNWQILEGLQPGERIIVNGVDKVKSGMIVTPKSQVPSSSNSTNSNKVQ